MATRREKLDALAQTATAQEMLETLWPVIDSAAVVSDTESPVGGRLVDLKFAVDTLDSQLGVE